MGANGTLTVGEIFRRVQNIFGDTHGIQITEDMVVDWVNDACREAVMQGEGRILQTLSTISTVAGQADYELPNNLFALMSVYHLTESSYYFLTRLPVSAMDRQIDGWQGTAYGTGTPQAYTVIGNKLYLAPVPSIATTDGIKLLYARWHTDVQSIEDSPDLPNYLHSYVEHFCMMKAYELDEDWESYDRKAALVQSTLNYNQNREATFGRETYPTIVEVPDYGV